MEFARIEPPGRLDGGDVLKVDRTAYVGLGSRTNAEGTRQLNTVIEPRGWSVVTVPVTQVLAPQVRRDRAAGRHDHRLRNRWLTGPTVISATSRCLRNRARPWWIWATGR